MVVNYEFGVDINSDWDFSHNDLNLVEYNDNLKQSIKNRLGTELDALELFYTDYGSILMNLLGLKNNDNTLKFLKIEVDNCLNKDPRINSFESDVSYIGDGEIRIFLKIFGADTDIDLNFVLSPEGINEEED